MSSRTLKEYPDQSTVRRLFKLKNNQLYWRIRPAYSVRIGALAGHVKHGHQRSIVINRRHYVARRLISIFKGEVDGR